MIKCFRTAILNAKFDFQTFYKANKWEKFRNQLMFDVAATRCCWWCDAAGFWQRTATFCWHIVHVVLALLLLVLEVFFCLHLHQLLHNVWDRFMDHWPAIVTFKHEHCQPFQRIIGLYFRNLVKGICQRLINAWAKIIVDSLGCVNWLLDH